MLFSRCKAKPPRMGHLFDLLYCTIRCSILRSATCGSACRSSWAGDLTTAGVQICWIQGALARPRPPTASLTHFVVSLSLSHISSLSLTLSLSLNVRHHIVSYQFPGFRLVGAAGLQRAFSVGLNGLVLLNVHPNSCIGPSAGNSSAPRPHAAVSGALRWPPHVARP